MNKLEYEEKFDINAIKNHYDDCRQKKKSEKALEYAMEIRKFEIELYWKRATYFWTFIAAVFAGYALVYTKADGVNSEKYWILLVFSCLGFIFSVAWYLVNQGSKFWQNNWERHVDLLEDEVIGPLYKTIAQSSDGCNPLISYRQYSVSKINQILSFFVSLFWMLLILKSISPISSRLNIDWSAVFVLIITMAAVGCLFIYGKSKNEKTEITLIARVVSVLNRE